MAQTKSKSNSSSKGSKSGGGRSNGSGKTNSRKSSNGSSNSSSQEEQSTMLEELFHESLKDIYWAEKHLLKALPKMERAATSEELKQSFADHLEVTREQIARAEQAFELLGKKP